MADDADERVRAEEDVNGDKLFYGGGGWGYCAAEDSYRPSNQKFTIDEDASISEPTLTFKDGIEPESFIRFTGHEPGDKGVAVEYESADGKRRDVYKDGERRTEKLVDGGWHLVTAELAEEPTLETPDE